MSKWNGDCGQYFSEDLACQSLAIKRNNGFIHNSKDYSENITDKMNYTKFHKIKYNTKAIQSLVKSKKKHLVWPFHWFEFPSHCYISEHLSG